MMGCDDEPAEHVPAKHAEVRGAYHGELTVLKAQEWTLLHPNSDRQRQSRENLLLLEELDSAASDEEASHQEPSEGMPEQLVDELSEESP